MRSSRDVVSGPLVWVEDRVGTILPYSKGLMAASIMATGLPPGRAYELAGLIEEELLASGATATNAEVLIRRAASVLHTYVGPEISESYLAWRRAKRSPKPIVVLIGGATGVGKSTVATKLAARLDLTRIVTTDTVREILRGFLTPEHAPEIHLSSFESPSADPIPYFLRQATTVSCGVTGLVERTVAERKDVIVEGVHIVPGGLERGRLTAIARDSVLVQVLLVLDDPEVHRSHFLSRLENEHGRDPGRYLHRFGSIRRVQDHLIELARMHGVARVDAGSLDDAIQSVIDLVVAEVVAASEAAGHAIAV